MATQSYDKLLKRLWAVAQSPTAQIQRLGAFQSGNKNYKMVSMELGLSEPGKQEILIAGGIHGDEPASMEAPIRFLEKNAENNELLSRFHFVVLPCSNPSGYELGTRENAAGIDLNRQFSMPNPSPEVEMITKALAGRRFDFVFEMHEDIETHGLYLYEITADPGNYIGEYIIKAVESSGCPINQRHIIEHRLAHNGIIHYNTVRHRKTRVSQDIYIHRTCGDHVITLEPPASVLPLENRVNIELTALDAALRSLQKYRSIV